MYYSEDEITNILKSVNIKEYIQRYIKIDKIGKKWFGICPFHKETSPSFMIDEEKQMYYCFGCGKSGNIINFLMDYKKISFEEAMKELGFAKSNDGKEKISRLFSINEIAQNLYLSNFKESEEAIQYTKDRNLNETTIKKFGIGYSGKEKALLYEKLKKSHFTKEEIEQSGLVYSYNKNPSDKFLDRLMFPIHNEKGFIIGFGGRLMKDTKKRSKTSPKYINSPETEIFDKSANLFGLYFAKESMEDFFILCEGYMDVIAMHQAGFTNAVASLGTAFTINQAKLIKKYKNKVILSYDSDGPGIQAAIRAAGILEYMGIEHKFLNLSPVKDPDEFIKKYGSERFKERLRLATKKESWFLKQAIQTNNEDILIENFK